MYSHCMYMANGDFSCDKTEMFTVEDFKNKKHTKMVAATKKPVTVQPKASNKASDKTSNKTSKTKVTSVPAPAAPKA